MSNIQKGQKKILEKKNKNAKHKITNNFQENVDSNIYSFDNNEVEKCKLIRKMVECIEDVPKGRTEWILDGNWKKRLPKEMWYQDRQNRHRESQI